MKRLIAFAIILILTATTLCSCVDFHDHKPVYYTTYIVKSGDTLWAIATYSNGYGEIDRRCIIDDIKAASNCTSNLRVGQKLKIPHYEIEED